MMFRSPHSHSLLRRCLSLAMLVMMIGWFGVNVGVAGTATGRLLGIPDVAGMVLFALLALAMTWRGIGSLSWAALAAGVATVTLAAWGMHLASDAHGLALQSARTATDPISPIEAASLMVGYGAAFALRTPDFTIDLQHYVTEHAWGASWARGVLPMKTRSIMNLAMISALNRPHELEIHIRGAINNGVSKREMLEIFLQVAVYCGAPAMMDSIRLARKVWAEHGAKPA